MEEFPEAGFVVVRGQKRGAVGVFQRAEGGGFTYLRGKGNPTELEYMRLDFEPAFGGGETSPGEKEDEST